METRIIINFSYSGFKKETKMEDLFWKAIDVAERATSRRNLLIVLNNDTVARGQAKAFLKDTRSADLEILRVWSVDTCQMWLSGWGYVIDKYKKADRIVQIPGDLDAIKEPADFYAKLGNFFCLGGPFDLTIGDFQTGDQFGSKSLIDTYGTYPLMTNWFPDLTKEIFYLPLERPRSEFLNLKISSLKKLLYYRKFAYEQTLNMLIRSWNFKTKEWECNVQPHDLGEIRDDSSKRKYLSCMDQIERTERMLKVIWKEINGPKNHAYSKSYRKFIHDYNILERLSTSMRETAGITIRGLLGLGDGPDMLSPHPNN